MKSFFWIMYEINGKKIALREIRIPRNLLCILYLERKDVFNVFDALIINTWKRDISTGFTCTDAFHNSRFVYFLINKVVIFFFFNYKRCRIINFLSCNKNPTISIIRIKCNLLFSKLNYILQILKRDSVSLLIRISYLLNYFE